jgi:hypothetical protein
VPVDIGPICSAVEHGPSSFDADEGFHAGKANLLLNGLLVPAVCCMLGPSVWRRTVERRWSGTIMQFDLAVVRKKTLSEIVPAMLAELADWLVSTNPRKMGSDLPGELEKALREERKRGLIDSSLALQQGFYWFSGNGVNELLQGNHEQGWATLRKAVYLRNASVDFSIAADASMGITYESMLHQTPDWTLAFLLSEILGYERVTGNLARHIHGYYRTGVIEEILDDEPYRAYVAAKLARYVPDIESEAAGNLDVFAPLMWRGPVTAEHLAALTRYHVMRADSGSPYWKRKGITPTFAIAGFDLMPVQILASTRMEGSWRHLSKVNALLDLWSDIPLPSDANAAPVSDPLVEKCYSTFEVA